MQQDTFHKGYRLEAAAGNMDWAPRINVYEPDSDDLWRTYDTLKKAIYAIDRHLRTKTKFKKFRAIIARYSSDRYPGSVNSISKNGHHFNFTTDKGTQDSFMIKGCGRHLYPESEENLLILDQIGVIEDKVREMNETIRKLKKSMKPFDQAFIDKLEAMRID